MKFFKLVALATAVFLAAAGSADAKKCQVLKGSGSGPTLQQAADTAMNKLGFAFSSFMEGKSGLSLDGLGKLRFSCRTKSGKIKIDRNATPAEFQSELAAIKTINEPGACKVSIRWCL